MKAIVIALCVALCLTSCSAFRPAVISDPQIVRVPGATRYVAVDPSLTEPTQAPTIPVPLCIAPDGYPVLCDGQVVMWLLQMEAALQLANADKAAIAELGKDDGRRH